MQSESGRGCDWGAGRSEGLADDRYAMRRTGVQDEGQCATEGAGSQAVSGGSEQRG
jgi:hypothetical protein